MDELNKPNKVKQGTGAEGSAPVAPVAPSGVSTPSDASPAPVVDRDDTRPVVDRDDTRPVVPSGISTSIPAEYTASSNAELIQQLENRMAEYKPLSKEELKKLRRRQKVEGIISGISDAVQSISNLVFASKYAPNMYNAKEGMSAKAKERFDKEKAQQEAKADEFFNYALTIAKLKDAQEQKQYQRSRDAWQDQIRASQEKRAQLKADRDAAMADLRMQLMMGKISEQEAAAEAKRIEADYADQYWAARVEKEKSQTDKNNRWQPSSGGRSKKPEYPWYDRDGNLHYASSYEAMRQNALNHGTWEEATQESTTENEEKDRRGNITGTSSGRTVKPAKGRSIKPQQEPQPKKKNRLGL